MSDHDDTDARSRLSAMADGEVDAGQCARSCEAWADPGSEGWQAWHSYHLIGDVLRSQELASSPQHDAAFLERLRARLAAEAGVVATPAAAPAVRLRAWRLPLALAAGVAALASALNLASWPGGAGPTERMASASAPALPIASATPTEAAGPVVIRDAQLDRYLRAHRDYGAVQPVSLPGGAARRVETLSLQR